MSSHPIQGSLVDVPCIPYVHAVDTIVSLTSLHVHEEGTRETCRASDVLNVERLDLCF